MTITENILSQIYMSQNYDAQSLNSEGTKVKDPKAGGQKTEGEKPLEDRVIVQIGKEEKNFNLASADFRIGLYNFLKEKDGLQGELSMIRQRLGLTESGDAVLDENKKIDTRSVINEIFARPENVNSKINDALMGVVKFPKGVQTEIRHAIWRQRDNPGIRNFLKNGGTSHDLAGICKLTLDSMEARGCKSFADRMAMSYLKGFTSAVAAVPIQFQAELEQEAVLADWTKQGFKDGEKVVQNEKSLVDDDKAKTKSSTKTDETAELKDVSQKQKGGNQAVQYQQSLGANTCFAMSVLNACSKSKKMSEYLRTKVLSGDPNATKLNLISSKDCVDINDKDYTHKVTLKHPLEKAIVEWALKNEKDYRNSFVKGTNVLPSGFAVEFGKALGLVQSCPDVRIKGENEVQQDAIQEQQIKDSAAINDQIQAHLQNGGIVIMNVGERHFVAVTGIEGGTLTIVDSTDSKSFTKPLREYGSFTPTPTFYFLELPDDKNMEKVKGKVGDRLQKLGANGLFDLEKKKKCVEEILKDPCFKDVKWGVEINLDAPKFNRESILKAINEKKKEVGNQALGILGTSSKELGAKEKRYIELERKKENEEHLSQEEENEFNTLSEQKKVRNDAEDPYERLNIAIVQWQNAVQAAEKVGGENFKGHMNEYLDSLGNTIEGRQKMFDWGKLLDNEVEQKGSEDFTDWLQGKLVEEKNKLP